MDESFEAALAQGVRAGNPAALFTQGCNLLETRNYTESCTQFLLLVKVASRTVDALYRLNAKFLLGIIALTGLAGEADKAKGLEYMLEVASVDGSSIEGVPAHGLATAESLVIHAQYNLGKAAAEPTNPVNVDYASAEKWWLLAAREGLKIGSVDAQLRLGKLYATSRRREPRDPLDIIPENFPEAYKWLEHAVRNGSEDAKLPLGLLYKDGAGGKKNTERAISLLRDLADAGNVTATANLMVLYHSLRMHQLALAIGMVLTLITVPDAELSTWSIDSTEREARAAACFIVARCYEKGLGMEANQAEAITLYKRAFVVHKPTAFDLRKKVEMALMP